MINTKSGIVVTSEEEEGDWDLGNTKGASTVFVQFYFLAACEYMGMC